mgnify:CR=1 FL=1
MTNNQDHKFVPWTIFWSIILLLVGFLGSLYLNNQKTSQLLYATREDAASLKADTVYIKQTIQRIENKLDR